MSQGTGQTLEAPKAEDLFYPVPPPPPPTKERSPADTSTFTLGDPREQDANHSGNWVRSVREGSVLPLQFFSVNLNAILKLKASLKIQTPRPHP